MRPLLEAKKEVVAEIVDLLKDANSILFVDYKGITVAQDTELRRNFRKEGVTYKVYKNRLLVRALEQLGITGYDPAMFEGTTSVAVSNDEVAPAKVFAQAIKDYKKMDIKFGIVNGNIISKENAIALSKLPTKPVLISMLLGMLQAPVSSLARALNEIAKKEN